jgi:hypothetical protein
LKNPSQFFKAFSKNLPGGFSTLFQESSRVPQVFSRTPPEYLSNFLQDSSRDSPSVLQDFSSPSKCSPGLFWDVSKLSSSNSRAPPESLKDFSMIQRFSRTLWTLATVSRKPSGIYKRIYWA